MNLAKADFFDTMANAPWAVEAYRAEDRPEIDRFMVKAEIRPGAWALEPGCGAGRLTEILADAVGPDGLAVALDISPKMVAACRARVGHCGNVQIHHAVVEEYATEPERFDVIVCHQVFPHFDDKAAALARLSRALKRPGRLLVVHFSNASVINEFHRGADPVVQGDLLPMPAEMCRLCAGAGLVVDCCFDDELGYLVRATPIRGARS